MTIKIIIFAIGLFLYLIIGGILDAHFDLGPACVIWPIVFIVIVPMRLGYIIYEWYRKKRWKKLIGGENNDKTD